MQRVILINWLPPVQVSAMFFPKVLLHKLFGQEALSGQISHSHSIGCQMKRVWVVSSYRRSSAHTHGGLSLQPLSQLVHGSERALQLSEARRCFRTGKHQRWELLPWGSDRGHTTALLLCEAMG